jgi:hypothetical protein
MERFSLESFYNKHDLSNGIFNLSLISTGRSVVIFSYAFKAADFLCRGIRKVMNDNNDLVRTWMPLIVINALLVSSRPVQHH